MTEVDGALKSWMLLQLMPDRMPGDRLAAASIESGAICNLRCPFCPTGNGAFGLSREFLSKDRFLSLLERIGPQLRALLFFRFGEPLLNPEFAEMTRAAVDRGLQVGISTNLSVAPFDEEAARRLVGSGLSYLSFSCDGASQETYGQYRVQGDFPLVMRNLRLLLEAKRRLRSDLPRLSWQFLIHRGNQHEPGLASDMARELAIPISFANMSIPRQFKKQWDCDRFAQDRPPAHPPRQCFGVWDAPQIHSDGTVLPCCVVSTPRFSLGNIFEEPLDDIWNRPLIVAMRRYLRSGTRPDMELPCYGCEFNPHRGDNRPADS